MRTKTATKLRIPLLRFSKQEENDDSRETISQEDKKEREEKEIENLGFERIVHIYPLFENLATNEKSYQSDDCNPAIYHNKSSGRKTSLSSKQIAFMGVLIEAD